MNGLDVFKNWISDYNLSDEVVLDIGAHTGEFYSAVSDKNIKKYHAFEPDSKNYEKLQNNLKIFPNVVFHNFGIFYGKSECKVQGIGDNNPGGYMVDAIEHDHKKIFNTLHLYEDKIFKLKTLEEVISEVPRLVKIDIEASEYNILENSMILKNTPILIVEWHNHDMGYVFNFISQKLSNHTIKYIDNNQTFLILKENNL
jgi:FkbM family methyltransferase